MIDAFSFPNYFLPVQYVYIYSKSSSYEPDTARNPVFKSNLIVNRDLKIIVVKMPVPTCKITTTRPTGNEFTLTLPAVSMNILTANNLILAANTVHKKRW